MQISILVEGDCFEAFVPVPDVAADGTAAVGIDAVDSGNSAAKVKAAAARLLARYGSFPASQISDEVASVGERTVRRHLARMVSNGELRVVGGGRSTRYVTGEADGV